MKLVNNTDKPIYVASTDGFAFTVNPGADRDVREFMVDLALAAGLVPVEGKKAPAPTLDEGLVEAVIVNFMKDGDPDNFTKAGKPKPQAVSAACGMNVPAKLINEIFDRLTTDGDSDGSD